MSACVNEFADAPLTSSVPCGGAATTLYVSSAGSLPRATMHRESVQIVAVLPIDTGKVLCGSDGGVLSGGASQPSAAISVRSVEVRPLIWPGVVLLRKASAPADWKKPPGPALDAQSPRSPAATRGSLKLSRFVDPLSIEK